MPAILPREVACPPAFRDPGRTDSEAARRRGDGSGVVALGLLGDAATVPFIEPYPESPIAELRWASAFALTRSGIAGPAVVDVLTQVVARPPERTGTMAFLSGSYGGLAAMALAEASTAPTLRTVAQPSAPART
ncbi:hypothetical protein [Streptomyces massasporeus]|uniref:hypothetical protein n=1 Tax=Streptomyces massasporeus TaxID=67324 RepID=UPI0036C4CFB5